MKGTLLRALGGVLVLVALTGGSRAATDGEAVAAAVVAAMAARDGATVTYDGVDVAGDDVTITGLALADPKRPDRTLSLPVLTLSGVAPREPGGFTAERASFDGGAVADRGMVLAWGAATAENAVIPTADEVKSAHKLRPFARLAMGDVRVTRGDAALASVAGLDVAIGEVVEGTPSHLAVTARGASVSSALAGGARRRALLDNLGYATMDFDLTLESEVDLYNDTWRLDPLVVNIADFGEVTVTGDFTGVSIGGFAVTSRRGAARQAAKVNGVEVHFANAGLVERALDMQASMMGVERSAFVENFLGAVPFMLNFIGNPPFQARLAVVAADFLRKPESITLRSKPPAPVSFEEVAKAASTNRGVLPDLLAVEISANQ